jgi:hypothetical protein
MVFLLAERKSFQISLQTEEKSHLSPWQKGVGAVRIELKSERK